MASANRAESGKTATAARRSCAVLVSLLVATHSVQAQGLSATESERRCGPVATPDHYGPYDYRTNRPRLAIVEKHHFTPAIEAGVHSSTAALMKELAYTLKASPNHHRALLTLGNQGVKNKSPQPEGLEYSIDCFFDRAIRFQADDNIVRIIYAQHLGQIGRLPDAKLQLDIATRAADDNPLTHHNIGLVYFEMNEFDLALVRAHEARRLGFEHSRLEKLLKQKGVWKDPAG